MLLLKHKVLWCRYITSFREESVYTQLTSSPKHNFNTTNNQNPNSRNTPPAPRAKSSPPSKAQHLSLAWCEVVERVHTGRGCSWCFGRWIEGETKKDKQIIRLKKGARYNIEITTWPPTLHICNCWLWTEENDSVSHTWSSPSDLSLSRIELFDIRVIGSGPERKKKEERSW